MDAVELADVAALYDDMHAHDAYNDVRYGMHGHDVPADAVHRVDAVVRADVVAPGQMHKFLITGTDMRIVVFS